MRPGTDLERLKADLDLRQHVETELGRPHSRGSRAWTWRCPFHGEQHGYSLAVWRDGWRCFGACQTGGDAIAWVMRRAACGFREALTRLGATADPAPYRRGAPGPRRPAVLPLPPALDPPPASWQAAARHVVEQAEQALWQAGGWRARRYLRDTRGLHPETIRAGRLGYVAGRPSQWRRLGGLWVPCGILLPWFADGQLWGIKVRRAGGERRYAQVSGGALGGGLYGADARRPGSVALIVEGEFNALIAWQAARDLVSAVSPGSASTLLSPRWYAALASHPRLLACFDADAAGEAAVARLRACAARLRVIQVPEGKDLNAYYLQAGPAALRAWLGHGTRSVQAPGGPEALLR